MPPLQQRRQTALSFGFFSFLFFSLSCSLSRSLAVSSAHRRPFLSATMIRSSSSQVLLRSMSHSFLFHVSQQKKKKTRALLEYTCN
jgi:hypothetical protein